LEVLSAGSAFFHWFRLNIRDNFGTLALLLAACLLLFSFAVVFAENEYASLRRMFGDGRFAVMLSELVTSATLFAVPSFLMGLIYSELMQRIADAGGSLGKASAVNTLGSALAAPVWVVFLFPTIGSKWVLMLIIAGYLFLAQIRILWTAVAGVSIVGFALLLPSNYSLFRESAAASAWLNEGVMATVTVRRDETGRRSLYVNHRFQMGGTGSTAAEQRHADIPLLLHGHAKRALFLGLGTGISMGAARYHEGLRVDGVELLPGVIKSLPQFAPENGDPETLPNFRIYTADARRFVRCTTNQYDVIVADLFNPAHDGIGLLYSEEHFRAVKQRLQQGGLFCQWLPLYQMDNQTLRSIIATFLHVYEHSDAFLLRLNVDTPVLGLIGSDRELNFASGYSPMDEKLSEHLRQIGLADSLRLLGGYLGGTKELKRYAENARINTDTFPHLIFDAPVFSYNRNAASYATLTNLLFEIPISLPILLHEPGAGFTESLKRFMMARNRYLEGLVRESEGRGSEAIDLYIEASKVSADFTQGYARCISIVSGLAPTEHQSAVDLLKRLIQAQPDRILGKELLDRLTLKLPKP
ncbi:MAG: Spermine synthase, partial [Verrucomicrobiales bacterium]|nr:Spermine synthase [Verrucomicrobiales bacterium]